MLNKSDQRYFIITVDTEGDDQWHWKKGQKIKTENAKYINRFQILCEKYNIPPVYLINYEMAASDVLRDFLKEKAVKGLCEIGMHLHAWNSPPDYEMDGQYGAQPYITEYPESIIFEKHRVLKEYITERFGIVPVSYRSGRWATNDILWKVLNELGFCVDCSVAPGIVLNTPGATVKTGNNYKNSQATPYLINDGLMEIPMTSAVKRTFNGRTLKKKIRNIIKGEEMWLRPLCGSDMVKHIIKVAESENRGFLEAMVHSSELMPEGSPYINNQEELDRMYDVMENMFRDAQQRGYYGITLQEYYRILRG